MTKPQIPFGVQVNGTPIGSYTFRPAAATIDYTREYEWEQARIWAGMTIPEWDALPGTPHWVNPYTGGRSKCHIIVLYRMSNLIPAAAQDAQVKRMEIESKRKQRGGR